MKVTRVWEVAAPPQVYPRRAHPANRPRAQGMRVQSRGIDARHACEYTTRSTVQTIFRSFVVLCALWIVAAYAFGVDVASLPRLQTATTFLDRNGTPLGTILASDASHATAVRLAA